MIMFDKFLDLEQEKGENSKDMLFIWRKRIFLSIFISTLIAAFIPLFFNVQIAITSGNILTAVTYSLIYVAAIFVTFGKFIPFEIRVWSGLLLFYLMGVVSLTTVGPAGSGRMLLFMFVVLTTLILGLRAGIIALALNVFTMLLWIWACSNNYFSLSVTHPFSASQIQATGFTFLFINLVATVSLGIFVNVLKKGFEKEQDLSNELKGSNEKLLRENEERKRTQDALSESEQKYRLLADNVNDMIWLMDIEHQRITYISPSVKKMRGYTPAEVMEQSLDEILTPESYQRAVRILADELAGDEERDPDRSVTMELEQYRQDGSTMWTEIAASIVRDNEKRPIAILGVTRDITERKEAEQALRDKEEKLARSKKMESLGLMAGGVAHDLNNILSGIVSYPELLLMNLPEDSPLRKPIKTIQESGMRAADVVEDLMTIARGVASSKEVLNLNIVAEEYLKSVEHQKSERTHSFVNFKTDLDPDLLNMSGSPTHIKKTLMNLVSNASEAIEGRGTVTISTVNQYLDEPMKGYEDVRTGEYVMLTVSDSGSGIFPGDLERIFEPFYTKKVMGRSGTGLGLTVVWNTVQDHDGYINVKSSEKGTVFELYFPVTRKEVAAKGKEVPLEDYLGHRENILVVDDEDRQREIASGMLTELGYNAESVSSGEDAIEFVKEHPVDLIVLDMVMPKGINGRETYEEIIKIHPGQKAIIASGYAKTKEVDIVQGLGAGMYIKKPYILEKIGLAVKEELGK